MSRSHAAVAAFLLLTNVACTSVTPAGLLAAARLNPLGSDPADITAAVSVPSTVGVQTGDLELRFAYAPTSPGVESIDERFVLEVRGTTELPGADPNDAHFTARIEAEDVGRLRSAQASVRRLRASGDDGVGTLFIGLGSACHTGAIPETLPVSTWLRTDAAGRFVRLTRTTDLLDVLERDDAAQGISLRPCTAEPPVSDAVQASSR